MNMYVQIYINVCFYLRIYMNINVYIYISVYMYADYRGVLPPQCIFGGKCVVGHIRLSSSAASCTRGVAVEVVHCVHV